PSPSRLTRSMGGRSGSGSTFGCCACGAAGGGGGGAGGWESGALAGGGRGGGGGRRGAGGGGPGGGGAGKKTGRAARAGGGEQAAGRHEAVSENGPGHWPRPHSCEWLAWYGEGTGSETYRPSMGSFSGESDFSAGTAGFSVRFALGRSSSRSRRIRRCDSSS